MCVQSVKPADDICYLRAFSELGEYQQEYKVTYSLHCLNEGCLLEIRQDGKKSQIDQCKVQLPKQKALQVITLLYENAVSVTTWRDVLEDLHVPCL